MNSKNSPTKSINSYFLRIFIPIGLIFSVVMSSFLSWNDYKINKSSRLESQKLIFEMFVATVRQPLLQGSLIEAKVRATELLKNKQVACIQITTNSEIIISCEKNVSSKILNKIESDLYFNEENQKSFSHVVINFDNSDLVSEAWKKVSQNIFGFVLLSTILLLILSIGFSRLRKELNELLKITGFSPNKNQEAPKFKITEFSALGSSLKNQFEVTKAHVEAKAALEVAKQVAHDIRSPILSLQIAIHAAQNQLTQKHHDVLIHATQRLSDIANDVLNQHMPFTQSMNSFIGPGTIPMSISVAINEMVAEKKLLCKNKPKITIETAELKEDILIEIGISDFQRVISNILDNSIHAVHENGNIFIDYERTDLGCKISISDNGIGMSQKVLKAVSEKGGSFGKVNGNGLGFQWAKKTIERYNGHLEVTSKEGSGTTVTIFLPLLLDQIVTLEKNAFSFLKIKEA